MKNAGQRWSLSAIHALRDTGASLHNGDASLSNLVSISRSGHWLILNP